MPTRPTAYPHLFEPGAIAGLRLRNRIVQSAMGTGMAEDGRVSARDLAIQEERAAGGVGLIVFGGTAVHPTSRFPARILIESWDEAIVESLRVRAEAVHRHGAAMIGQLIHLGREAPGGLTEAVPLAPSAIASPRNPIVPREMTDADIREIVESFGRSAANYAAAGIDGAEIHAAHGYLVAQFLSAESNHRLDVYRGDTPEGRTRFLVEIVEEIRARCGPDYPLGVRLSADEHTPGGMMLDDTLEIVDALQESAPVDYLSITTGQRGGYVKDSSWDEGFALGLSEAVKEIVDVPVIVAGRIRLPGLAERALEAGQADFVAVGRGMLADSEWVAKARDGQVGRIRPCIGLVQDCRRYAGGVTCTINPRLGREAEWPELEAGDREPRRVVVAGGGPAGLEAARVAAEAGHSVVLFERENVVGGQLRQAAAGPTREELLDFVFYLERELDRLGVDVRLGAAATAADVVAGKPDLFVCATGAVPEPQAFAVAGDARVVTVWDLLGGRCAEIPKRALVLDDGGGFWQGISAAEYLAERGADVELVSPARAVGLGIPEESVANVHRRLRSNGARFRALSQVSGVDGTTVHLADVISGEPSETAADLVVVVSSLRVEDGLAAELAGSVPALVAIGDCAAPRRLNHAVLEANLALRRFHEGRLGSRSLVLF
jgi:2,4-dienoyl-CoA reductase-like NADH-dependent reductase (Old Yellow Enzyme family)